MFKKIRGAMIIFIFISIIGFGFLKVSSELPQIIKDKSPIKVSFSTEPFDITLDAGNYMVYINKKAVDSMRNGTKETLNNISENNPITKLVNQFRGK